MTPGQVSARVVASRLALIDQLLSAISALPLDSIEVFLSDRRNVGASESYLRRGLEALLDIGRHILAKGFGVAVSEYKTIASELEKHGVLTGDEAKLLYTMAGYRNRMVHFYHEIPQEELYEICTQALGDVEQITNAYRRWMKPYLEQA